MLFPQLLKSTASTAAALLPLLLFDGVQGQPISNNNTQTITGFPPCDALIEAGLSHAVYLPSSSQFTPLLEAYWSLNTRKAPWCFVLPSSVSELSHTITTLRDAGEGAGDWHIAVRSGGHSGDDSNNIINGVTIDLSQINATTYDSATKVAGVSTGARWGDVYAALQKDDVVVTGGREGVVGVGGFVLGGGNSFYTSRTGFSCDTVVNYEIVLASGEVVNANATANSDLWRALKGGSGNFGIVTRFDMETLPAKNVTFEMKSIDLKHENEVVDAVYGFANLDRSFHDNVMLMMLAYNPEGKNVSISVLEANTVNDENSSAFDAFDRIPTALPSERQSLTLFDAANRSAVPEGTLNSGSYLTLANNKQIMHYCFEQHAALVTRMKALLGETDFSTILEFQPLPAYYADIAAEKGGNMMGLKSDAGNRLFFTAGVTMITESAQAKHPLVSQEVAAMTERIKAFSESVGGSDNFVYLNYAHANQNPLGSYGAANVDYIRETAVKYDPQGFFQQRVPGGFKIDRVTS